MDDADDSLSEDEGLPGDDGQPEEATPAVEAPAHPATLRTVQENLPESELSLDTSPALTTADRRRKVAKEAAAAQAVAEAIAAAARKEEAAKCIKTMLAELKGDGLTFGDVVLFVSDPDNWQGDARYNGFFSKPDRVRQVLDFWVGSRNSATGRRCVHEWAVAYVKGHMSAEGNKVTQSNLLQARTMNVDATFALDFSYDRLYRKFLDMCPTAMEVLEAFSTTPRQIKEATPSSERRKANVSVT